MAIHIRRREFIATVGASAVACPLDTHAQQPDRVRRIGVLMGYPESDSEAQAHVAAFREHPPMRSRSNDSRRTRGATARSGR
jgi:putative tryptophan/tyrosine transport system substrate-binding protein